MLAENSKMKITTKWTLNLKIPQAMATLENAIAEGLRDTVTLIANDVIKGSPVLTGNNRRSIRYESSARSGLIRSTSGYGGFLEVGTRRMRPRPYFKPAFDRHIGSLPSRIKARLN